MLAVDTINSIPTPHSEVFVDVEMDGAILGLGGNACASAPTAPGRMAMVSDPSLCTDGHGGDPFSGMLVHAWHCEQSNDRWAFDSAGHIVDAVWANDDARTGQQAGARHDMDSDSNFCAQTQWLIFMLQPQC